MAAPPSPRPLCSLPGRGWSALARHVSLPNHGHNVHVLSQLAGSFAAGRWLAVAAQAVYCDAGYAGHEVYAPQSASCVCDAGYYRDGGTRSCTACARHTYAPRPGTPLCLPCPAGSATS